MDNGRIEPLIILATAVSITVVIGIAVWHRVLFASYLVFVVGGCTVALVGIKRLDFNDWLTRVVLILALVNLAAMIYSPNPYYAKKAVIFNCVGLAVMLVSSRVLADRINQVILATVGLGTAGALYTVYLKLTIGYSSGFLANGNHTGHWLIVPVVLCVYLLFEKKWWASLPLGLFIYTHYIVRCRTAWIAIIIGVILIALWNIKKPKAMLAFSIVFAVVVGGIASLSDKNILDTSSLSYRTKYWATSVEMIKSNPVLGTGLRSYRNGVYDAQAIKGPEFFEGYAEPKPRHAHNDYLEVINDAGIIGFVLLAYLFVTVFRHGWRVREQTFPLLVAMVCIMIGMMFFFWRTLPLHTFTIACYMGCIEGCSRR